MAFYNYLASKAFLSYFFGSLVSLLTITNPLSKIPLFMVLTRDMPPVVRQQQARHSCSYAFAILTVSLFGGVFILKGFGISYGALRIAGGLTVALLGYRMLFLEQDGERPTLHAKRSVAFFPLAMPGISGPGAIAVVIGISSEIAELKATGPETIAYGATVTSIGLTCLLIWLILHSAHRISRWMGEEGIEALCRLMGFLLICIGVQFVGSGVRTFLSGT